MLHIPEAVKGMEDNVASVKESFLVTSLVLHLLSCNVNLVCILEEFAKKNEDIYNIKAGFMDGEVIGADKVDELAKLPSKEGLLSMLLSVLNGPIRGLAVALNAVVEKEPAAEEAAPAEEAVEAPAEAPAEEAPAAE